MAKRSIDGVSAPGAGKYHTLTPGGDSTYEIWKPVNNTNLNVDSVIEFSMTVGETELVT
jgi:hypothetical protein